MIDKHRILRGEQPVNWSRAFIVGFIGVSLMMAMVDIFNMAGLTEFSFQAYVGTLIWPEGFGSRAWVLGLLANWFIGGVFGILYGYGFEYVFKRANFKTGIVLGLAHTLFAAVIVFPFFNVVHDFFDTGLYPNFGLLGSGLGWATPAVILAGHLLFGATMGVLYGPVRLDRIRSRHAEPGDVGYDVSERGVITETEDPEDRMAI